MPIPYPEWLSSDAARALLVKRRTDPPELLHQALYQAYQASLAESSLASAKSHGEATLQFGGEISEKSATNPVASPHRDASVLEFGTPSSDAGSGPISSSPESEGAPISKRRAKMLREAEAQAAIPTGIKRYERVKLMGQGGMGAVWLAHDVIMQREVALKELLGRSASNQLQIDRFLRAARITGQLDHPNIIPVFEISRGNRQEPAFYTMKFVR
ncbi:MAG: hypothetical protein KDB07_12650, partial [Planctomycetes bacterium]|nr:hypothetical protein [Planctomycetota bacterium]